MSESVSEMNKGRMYTQNGRAEVVLGRPVESQEFPINIPLETIESLECCSC